MARTNADRVVSSGVWKAHWRQGVHIGDHQARRGQNDNDGYVYLRSYSLEQEADVVLLYVHGGGWLSGSVDGYDKVLCAVTHLLGVPIVAVEYRLAPESAFPAALEDCAAALEWVAQHGGQALLGGRADLRVGLIGDSAGGNLCAALSRLYRTRESVEIAFQVLMYPVTDLDTVTTRTDRFEGGHILKPEQLASMWEMYLDTRDLRVKQEERPPREEEVEDPLLLLQDRDHIVHNPLVNLMAAREHRGLPRTFVLVAERDVLCEEGRLYGEALSRDGVDVTVRQFDDMHHGFAIMIDAAPQAMQAWQEIRDWIRSNDGTVS